MLRQILNNASRTAKRSLAWMCLLAGTALLGVVLLGIWLPLIAAALLLAQAAAWFRASAGERSDLDGRADVAVLPT